MFVCVSVFLCHMYFHGFVFKRLTPSSLPPPPLSPLLPLSPLPSPFLPLSFPPPFPTPPPPSPQSFWQWRIWNEVSPPTSVPYLMHFTDCECCCAIGTSVRSLMNRVLPIHPTFLWPHLYLACLSILCSSSILSLMEFIWYG